MSSTPAVTNMATSIDSLQHVTDRLRRLAPRFTRAHWRAAKRLAIRQADQLVRRAQGAGLAADEYVAGLAGLCVERHEPMPVSVISFHRTADDRWVVHLRASDPHLEQRHALVHEFKHILDRPMLDRLYSPDERVGPAEGLLAADLFADRCLVPQTELRQAVDHGLTEPREVAAFFDCTETVAARQLAQMRRASRAHTRSEARR